MRSLFTYFVCLIGLLPATAYAQDGEKLIKGVSCVGLSVSDLDKAIAFYRDACDLEIVEEKTLSELKPFDALAGRSGVTAETRMMEGQNAQLRLMQFKNPSEAALAVPPVPVIGPGFMHVCF